MSVHQLETSTWSEIWSPEVPDGYTQQDPLGVVGGIHGAEEIAVEVVKVAKHVPNTVPIIASYASVVAGQRWRLKDNRGEEDENMSGAFPGRPDARTYNGQRAHMLTARIANLNLSDIIEFHGSPDTVDVAWICVEQASSKTGVSCSGLETDRLIFPYRTSERTILKLLSLGINTFVVTDRRFNLMGQHANAAVVDLGKNTAWRNREYAYDKLFWLANEYDPRLDLLADLAGTPRSAWPDLPKIRVFEHHGWVPVTERDRVRLPERMETLEPIDPDKAEALGLPHGALAASWLPGLFRAGEVFTPCKRALPGVLGLVTGLSLSAQTGDLQSRAA